MGIFKLILKNLKELPMKRKWIFIVFLVAILNEFIEPDTFGINSRIGLIIFHIITLTSIFWSIFVLFLLALRMAIDKPAIGIVWDKKIKTFFKTLVIFKRKNKIIVLILLSIISVNLSAEKKIKINLKHEHKKFFVDFVFKPEQFLSMEDKTEAPETLNTFFTKEIYEKLSGTICIGFNYDQGFRNDNLKQKVTELSIDIIKGTYSTKKYIEAFKIAFYETCKEENIKISKNAKFRLGICVVGIQPKTIKKGKFKTHAGLIAEIYIVNSLTKKTVFRRIYNGKKEGIVDGRGKEISALALAFFDASLKILETLKI